MTTAHPQMAAIASTSEMESKHQPLCIWRLNVGSSFCCLPWAGLCTAKEARQPVLRCTAHSQAVPLQHLLIGLPACSSLEAWF